jgi:DNA-binding response OmpR family regulator
MKAGNTVNKVVLVVEDNQALNELFKRHLQRLGLKVHSVFTVAEGDRYIRSDVPPALVILDLGLKDGSGTQILDLLKNHQTIKTIVVSGDAYQPHSGLDKYSVDYVLLKPVSPYGLAALVKSIL